MIWKNTSQFWSSFNVLRVLKLKKIAKKFFFETIETVETSENIDTFDIIVTVDTVDIVYFVCVLKESIERNGIMENDILELFYYRLWYFQFSFFLKFSNNKSINKKFNDNNKCTKYISLFLLKLPFLTYSPLNKLKKYLLQ